MEFLVRDARPDDAQAVAEVHVQSWQQAYAGLLPQEMLAGLGRPADVAARAARWESTIAERERRVLVVAIAAAGGDGAVVGFAAFGSARDEPDAGELMAFYLDPRWWGHGAGRALHERVVSELDRDHARSILWVLRGNERAMRFYRAAGWWPDGGTKTASGPDGVELPELRYARSSL